MPLWARKGKNCMRILKWFVQNNKESTLKTEKSVKNSAQQHIFKSGNDLNQLRYGLRSFIYEPKALIFV